MTPPPPTTDHISSHILTSLTTSTLLQSTTLPYSQSDIHASLLSLSSKNMICYETTKYTIYKPTDEGVSIRINGSPEYNVWLAAKENRDIGGDKVGVGHALKKGWVEIYDGKMRVKKEDVEDEIYDDDILSKEYTTKLYKPYNFNTRGLIPSKGNLHPLMKVREEVRNIFLNMGFSEMRTAKYAESSFWNFDALFQPQNHPSRDAHDTFFVKTEDLRIDAEDEYVERVRSVHEDGGYGSVGYMNSWSIDEARKAVLRTHTTAISARYLKEIARLIINDKKGDNNNLNNNKLKGNNVNINNLNINNINNNNSKGNGVNGNNTVNGNNSVNVFNSGFINTLSPSKTYKLFSIDKVFRNESLDATHLAEFDQIEGIIVGANLTLGMLMSTLQSFFERLGMTKLKFKPAFNPYTEPSMEIFAYHPGLKVWLEIGNSGVFRPEMLGPMGFGEDVRIFGWGLSLERPTMIKYGIDNIRELVGHKVSYEFIRKSGLCYF